MSKPFQDGNGVLNMEELRAWESGLFHTEAAMIKLIQIADKDGDMQATAEELENAREEKSYHDLPKTSQDCPGSISSICLCKHITILNIINTRIYLFISVLTCYMVGWEHPRNSIVASGACKQWCSVSPHRVGGAPWAVDLTDDSDAGLPK